MDVCCLNRPFDDVTQDRIYLEAEAISSIIAHCEEGRWILVASAIIEGELARSSNLKKLEKVKALYAAAKERVLLTSQAAQRAAFLQQHGLAPFDSVHLALAEAHKVDVFLTTDDRLLRSASKLDLQIKVANPVVWLMEVTHDE